MDISFFDLGGVLVTDPWESMLLTPDIGLADRLGLDRDAVARVAQELWEVYSLTEASEEEYWSDFERGLGVSLRRDLIEESQRVLLYANPNAELILSALRTNGIRVGIVSDNTSFWYPKEARLLNLEKYVDDEMVFLSYRHGVSKKDEEGGLFDLAAAQVSPPRSVIVDDRRENLRRAKDLGFVALHYSMDGSTKELAQVLGLHSSELRAIMNRHS